MKKLIVALLFVLSASVFAGGYNKYDEYLYNLESDIIYYEEKRVNKGLTKAEQEYLNYLRERLEQMRHQLQKENPNL